MKVVVTSDFHEDLPPDVPACDLLLLAGDCLPASGGVGTYSRSRPPYITRFAEWLDRQYAHVGSIVGIAGNHDFIAKTHPAVVRALPWIYLENEARKVVVGGETVKVFGSPMSMPFGGWEFMAPEHDLEKVWKAIPRDVEILMVHGPAEGILDKTRGGTLTGSRTLRKRLGQLPKLKLLVTGHIHEAYGTAEPMLRSAVDPSKPEWLRCVNGSWMNEMYRPGNPPIEIEL